MTTREELSALLATIDTDEEQIVALMRSWEDNAIPVYDKVRQAMDGQDIYTITLAVAAAIGQFAKDVDPNDTDSIIDMFAIVAKARLLLLKEAALGYRQ